MHTFALDLETYYDDVKTVKKLGNREYFNSLDLSEIYLLVAVGDEGTRWVGHPKDFNWGLVDGQRVVLHNAGFDNTGFERLKDLGVLIPDFGELHDTADMAAYCGLPRTLAGAIFTKFGVKLDKTVRDVSMKGQRWETMSPELQEKVKAYALDGDGDWTLKLWQEMSPLWPEPERIVSKLSRQWAMEGICVDEDGIDKDIAHLQQFKWQAARGIPWANSEEDFKGTLSAKKLGMACREAGIPAPISLAIDSEECEAWEDQYGDKFPWVGAMRDFRRSNMLLKKMLTMKARVFKGRMRYELKYWGAGITGRWSGGGSLNMQNLNAKEIFGVKVREKLVAGPGMILCPSDLCQIEPRVSKYYCGDSEALVQMASGISPYIVHGRQTMGLAAGATWDKADARYRLAKIRVLGLGYGCGHHKLIEIARKTAQIDLLETLVSDQDRAAYEEYVGRMSANKPEWKKIYTEASEVERLHLINAWMVVDDFRAKDPVLVSQWNKLGDLLKVSAARGEDMEIELASGRSLVYKKCRFRGKEVVADITRNGRAQTARLYGSLIYENIVQGTARDAFRDCLIRLNDSGYNVVLHVHDEAVCEVSLNRAEHHQAEIERIMGISPDWAKRLPVAAEAKLTPFYTK